MYIHVRTYTTPVARELSLHDPDDDTNLYTTHDIRPPPHLLSRRHTLTQYIRILYNPYTVVTWYTYAVHRTV